MGLKERLGAAKRWMWSPMQVDLLERGSDTVVRAGEPARVVVDVGGEDDGTAARIEVTLVLNHTRTWVLGEVPPALGRHELVATIPEDVPPTSLYTEYRFVGKLERTKGTGSEGVSPVRVIGHPDHLHWPEGPRAGSDDAGLAVELDQPVAESGGTISGRVIGGSATVEVGAVVDRVVGQEGRPNGVHKVEFRPVASVTPDAAGAFTAAIPDAVPPTLHDGEKASVVWEVRATAGDVTAWRRFGLLDPRGTSEVPEQRAAGLLDVFY